MACLRGSGRWPAVDEPVQAGPSVCPFLLGPARCSGRTRSILLNSTNSEAPSVASPAPAEGANPEGERTVGEQVEFLGMSRRGPVQTEGKGQISGGGAKAKGS